MAVLWSANFLIPLFLSIFFMFASQGVERRVSRLDLGETSSCSFVFFVFLKRKLVVLSDYFLIINQPTPEYWYKALKSNNFHLNTFYMHLML